MAGAIKVPEQSLHLSKMLDDRCVLTGSLEVEGGGIPDPVTGHLYHWCPMAYSLWTDDSPDLVVEADNALVLPLLPSGVFTVIYIDPPFNTGRVQKRQTLRTLRSDTGGRVGFKGKTYETVRGTITQYDDIFADYGHFSNLG